MRASGTAFLAGVKLTFRSWSVDEAGRDTVYQYGNCTRQGCGSTIGIPIAMLTAANPHERAARAAKVAKILTYVPAGATRAEMDGLADVLASWGREDRARFAAACGALPPSDATWAEVVAGARQRLSAAELILQTARLDEVIR